MPDDLVLELELDAHSAIVAITHDSKLDDMALLEVLKSPAFYVGALGSRGNTAKRKDRMAMFDLSSAEIDRLHGPVGLHLGSKTPAEIAVEIIAEILAVKNGVVVSQKKPGSSVACSNKTQTRAAGLLVARDHVRSSFARERPKKSAPLPVKVHRGQP